MLLAVTFSAGCCGRLFFLVCNFVCMVYIHLLCKLHGCQDHECAESLTRKVVISYAFVYKSEIIAPPSKLLSRECFAYLCGFIIMMPGPSQAHRQTIARPALKGMDVMLNHGMTLVTQNLCSLDNLSLHHISLSKCHFQSTLQSIRGHCPVISDIYHENHIQSAYTLRTL